MTIDLHIHSKASDGKLGLRGIFEEAKKRSISFISITDHDTVSCQKEAIVEAEKQGTKYITGVELNVTFSYPNYHEGKTVSLDLLGYQFDESNKAMKDKLKTMAKYREERAQRILENVNLEFGKEGIKLLTKEDFKQIEESVDGVLGRPHIADYLVKKNIVKSRQEAFDKYLVKCDVPKYPFYLEEASILIRNAGGKLVLAHPNDPHGTSLVSLTKSLDIQTEIIREKILGYIDGIECWHSRNTSETTTHYISFAEKHKLIMTGGTDCHQKPIIMGTVHIPDWVVNQF
jgi:predicted metal-dependent phosphoesterase TrpH